MLNPVNGAGAPLGGVAAGGAGQSDADASLARVNWVGFRTIVIREGVRQAIDAGYDILNCSFGCGVKEHILQYKDWIDEAYLKGIHIVAACNNIDFRRPEWPGFFPSVITVTEGAFGSLTLSASTATVAASGASGSVGVTASNSGFAWTAVSNVSWLTIVLGASGTGSGTRDLLFPSLPYIAVYRVREQSVEVLRIYHNAQERP